MILSHKGGGIGFWTVKSYYWSQFSKGPYFTGVLDRKQTRLDVDPVNSVIADWNLTYWED